MVVALGLAALVLPQVVHGVADVSASAHCQLEQGGWCTGYWTQAEVPSRPPPRGSKVCPNRCGGVGNCDYDTGVCSCPAGYGGDDCTEPRKRPCWRMGPDRRDLGWLEYEEWSHSRCAGICDDNIAMCWCPPDTKHGRRDAPPGSPLGAPPAQRGRPLYWCQPSSDENGNAVKWGAVTFEDLFGESGWCNKDDSKFTCPCRIDGVVGQYCNIPVEQYCFNQCNGRGECDQGFCKCHEGWYGMDCSRKRANSKIEPDDRTAHGKVWLEQVLTPTLAAADPPASPTRRRPFVYVYDTLPDYNTDIMQYRIERSHCTHRIFEHGNRTSWVGYNAYAAESVLIELFHTSGHRTFDPEEADYFFVPTAAGCIFDVYGWNPIPMWPEKYHGSRPFGSSNMVREAYRWLSRAYPYFNRTGGQDHIWFFPHDEGACSAPKEIWTGVILSHWGRMDFPHTSNSQYMADNYSQNHQHALFPDGWVGYSSGTHPCFDPSKDLVVPCFKQPSHYRSSPYMGGEPAERDILAFFRGDVERPDDQRCIYSRCIRQTLYKLSKEHDWKGKHNIVYGTRQDSPGDYGDYLKKSRYCFALPGDGWSARFEDSVLHGCIPVIIMDNTQVPFESILQADKFTVRIAQSDLERVPEILQAIPKSQEDALRAGVHKVWQRFRYRGLTMIENELNGFVDGNKLGNGGSLREHPGTEFALLRDDDAFHTIIQWLHSRIPHTRGKPRTTETLFLPPQPTEVLRMF